MEKPMTKFGKRCEVYGFSELIGSDWIVVPTSRAPNGNNFKTSAYLYAKRKGFKVSVRQLADGTGYLVEKV